MQPSLVFDFDDSSEALIFGELAIDSLQVSLVLLKYLNEAIHAELVPPALLLQQGEAASQYIPHVATASNVRR